MTNHHDHQTTPRLPKIKFVIVVVVLSFIFFNAVLARLLVKLRKVFFVCWRAPFGYLYLSLFSNEPELGTKIDPGMFMTPFPRF
jgi:hypothetical protein